MEVSTPVSVSGPTTTPLLIVPSVRVGSNATLYIVGKRLNPGCGKDSVVIVQAGTPCSPPYSYANIENPTAQPLCA